MNKREREALNCSWRELSKRLPCWLGCRFQSSHQSPLPPQRVQSMSKVASPDGSSDELPSAWPCRTCNSVRCGEAPPQPQEESVSVSDVTLSPTQSLRLTKFSGELSSTLSSGALELQMPLSTVMRIRYSVGWSRSALWLSVIRMIAHEQWLAQRRNGAGLAFQMESSSYCPLLLTKSSG